MPKKSNEGLTLNYIEDKGKKFYNVDDLIIYMLKWGKTEIADFLIGLREKK